MKTTVSTLALLFAATLTAVGCHHAGPHNLPPAERLQCPGPGVTGPGPGVLTPPVISAPFPTADSQVLFSKPEGMQARWMVADGMFDNVPLIVPGRQNFPQGAIYRLKLTNVPGREGTELYPTLEIGPATPRTEAFLAHNAIPVQFTEEDFDQVLSGNFVTKVIYLPDPEFQELALAGVGTLVSTRLDPGVDPVVEADRRGAILAIIRLGNKDVEQSAMTDGGFEVIPAGYSESGVPVTTAGLGIGHHGAPHGVPSMPSGPVPPGQPSGYGFPPFGGALPPNYVAGVTAPDWGMPMTGTPIGLPGPPHIPLGSPAGLQRHTIRNHTHINMPQPTEKIRIDVKQRPGFSYPRSPNHVRITEENIHPAPHFHQPHGNQFQELH